MPAGRPRKPESELRRRDFIRRIASGDDFAQAALEARIAPVRALAILSQPEIRQLIAQAAA